MSLPSFTAAGWPAAGVTAEPHQAVGAAALGPGPAGPAPDFAARSSAGVLSGPPPQPSRQASSIGHASSQSAYHWGRVHPVQLQLQQQQQALVQSLQPPQQQQPYTGAMTHGSLQGISPSQSSGSLAQYSMAGGAVGAMAASASAGSLLMAGPGSLCAALPRYVRHPPIEAVVFGWGVSEDGQLGVAEGRGDVMAPKVVEALLGVQFSGRAFSRTPLVAGSRNTLALDAAGQVWSFGWNDRGNLGHGHRDRETKPKRVAALKGIRVVQVAMGGWHCLALSDRGTMFAWGGNEYGQCGSVMPGQRDITEPLPVDLGLGPNQRVRQVAAGGMHSLALLEDGTVWQWGENWGDFSMHPVRTPRPVPGAVAVAAVCCGAFHNLALTAGGRVLSWGMNDYGQLGNGSTTYAVAPHPVLDMDSVVVADIAAGGWHSCALSSAGEVWVWGRGEYGRLGLGDRSGSSKLRPQKVRGLEAHVVVQVAAGGSHTLALTSTARLFVWGRGAFGRLGLGEPGRDCYHPVECPLPGGTERWRVAAIGAGGRHSMCLAIPVRDTATSALGMDQPEDEDEVASAGYGSVHGSASALLQPHLTAALAAAAAAVGSGGFGSVISQHMQALQGLTLGRKASEEIDNLDGYSEPSLYDRDMHLDISGHPTGASPVRTRRATAATADGSGTADGSVTADGSITAASSIVALVRSGSGAAIAAAACGAAPPAGLAGGDASGAHGPAPPTLQPVPPSLQGALTEWPSLDSSGAARSADSSSTVGAAPPPTPTDPMMLTLPPTLQSQSQSPTRSPEPGSANSTLHGSVSGAPSSPPPSLASVSASSSLTASGATTAPRPAPLTVRPGSMSLSPPPPPSPAGSAAVAETQPEGPSDSPRSTVRPKSPLRPQPPPPPPPPGSVALPSVGSGLGGMRRSSSAIGPLGQLTQILPEPAAVAAAAMLDADSDLAPPRGLAAAVAAAAAAAQAAAVASGGCSVHSGVGGGSRCGSITGMVRCRTVFGGGGEEEDEAMQAAEAAEAAAEEYNGGSGTGEDDIGGELDDEQDDTDEDQVYDSSGVAHPRSPSLLSRPRSPPVPLSPRRHASLSMNGPPASGAGGGGSGAGSGGGSGGGSRSASPAVMVGGAAAGVSGSPSSRALLASYGSPRVPSTLMQ